ncbi:sterol desaturase family protein [Mesorhizobium sp. NZP2077]|uniref:sterol desaturase family protein n=1 Tax=Mesorhizobium sp. NZP2077 TaxID=2483404 RepID=UPI001553FEF0|nr:sterol desaturase family protein [Mesorhizobium sp. NZP2077]QKC86614.1 sterol desaturase family protein [Mesorhizobium sp. NZP2077]QKD19016.1 sterol desaturase family protein [Mesorhizobium sp. NZP2077]
MDDALYGTRDKRGNWKPAARLQYPQVFVWPLNFKAILRWIPDYLAPWNFFYAAIAVAFWLWLTPSMETARHFAPGWIALIFLRNLALVIVFFGSFHLRLYRQRKQGTQFKYNGKWLDTDNPEFLFGNQTVDNLIWSLGSGVPVWTAYEAVSLWMFANSYIPFVSWAEHPLYNALIMLLIPLFREVHFYVVHRMIHWPPLYRTVHKLHHTNVNPGPWSGLAMHPVEHLLYFSGVLIHWIVPSHPLHSIFHLVHLGLAPAAGHTGFDKVVMGEESAFDTHCYAHYLHHKYFECNYSDGSLPLDKWFGSFHDGTEEAHQRMNERFMARAARQARQGHE